MSKVMDLEALKAELDDRIRDLHHEISMLEAKREGILLAEAAMVGPVPAKRGRPRKAQVKKNGGAAVDPRQKELPIGQPKDF